MLSLTAGAIAPRGLGGCLHNLTSTARKRGCRPGLQRGGAATECRQVRIASPRPGQGGGQGGDQGRPASWKAQALAIDAPHTSYGDFSLSAYTAGLRKVFAPNGPAAVLAESLLWVAALSAPVLAVGAIVGAAVNPQALLHTLGMANLSAFGGAFLLRMYLVGFLGAATAAALYEHRAAFISSCLSCAFKVPITCSSFEVSLDGAVIKDLVVNDGDITLGKVMVRTSFVRLCRALKFVYNGGAPLEVECVRVRDVYLRAGVSSIVRALKHGISEGFDIGEAHLHHVVVDVAADHIHKLHKVERWKEAVAEGEQQVGSSEEQPPSGDQLASSSGSEAEARAASGAAASASGGADTLRMEPRTGRIALRRLRVAAVDSHMTPAQFAHAFEDIEELNCSRRGNSKMLDAEAERSAVAMGWDQLLQELQMPALGPLGNVPMDAILAKSVSRSEVGRNLQRGIARMDAGAKTITQLQQWSPGRIEDALRKFGGAEFVIAAVQQDLIGRVLRREGRLEKIVAALQQAENGLLHQIMQHTALVKTLVMSGTVVKLLDSGLVDKMLARPRLLSKVLECCVLEELVALGVVDSLTKPENNDMLHRLVDGSVLEVLADTHLLPALVSM